MTSKDEGHYRNKHPVGIKVNPEIAEAVKKNSSNQKISCAAAFTIANELNGEPQEVGMAIDSLEISLTKCQLGLFGYGPDKKAIKPTENIDKDHEEAIRECLTNDRLSCKDAWEIADRCGIKRMGVTSACEVLKIKISSCQLGAFK